MAMEGRKNGGGGGVLLLNGRAAHRYLFCYVVGRVTPPTISRKKDGMSRVRPTYFFKPKSNK